MVKVTKIVEKDDLNHKIVAELVCDQQSEVSGAMEVQGLPSGYTLGFGSTAVTTSLEVGMLNSSGLWIWG